MRNIILVTILLFSILSCGRKSEESATADAVESAPHQAIKNQLASTPKIDLYSDGKTKLIKEANYRFEVKSVKESTAAIETALRKYPAYVSASSLKLENPILENTMTIRIQSDYFNDLLQDIDKQAIFVNLRNVNTDDVSKEFVDLESRLNTKREVETRYMTILRNKAGTIEELLNAEKQIGALHEEIEATISRINYLRDQVNYSSINLEFYQTVTETIAKNEDTSADKFSDAFTTGFQGMITLLIAVAYLWPLIILALGILLIVTYRKKRLSKLKVQ